MLTGSMFKVFHWPGAGILLTLSIFLFCFHFLPSSLMELYKGEEEKKYKLLYIVTFIVFFIDMLGVLFKVQHWPGAGMFLLIGIPLPFILFLPVYLYQTRNENKKGNMNFLGIMFGLIFLAVFSVFLALNVSRNILDKIAVNISTNDYCTFLNQTKAKKYIGENKIKKNADELYSFIEVLKSELLDATQNKLSATSDLPSGYIPAQINNQENSTIPMQILYGEDDQQGKIAALKIKINAYKEALVASGQMNPELAELTNSLFDISTKPSDNQDDAEGLTWEQREFSNYQLIVVLDVLSQIQSNVKLVESEFLATTN